VTLTTIGTALFRAYCNSLVWFTLGTVAGGTWVALILVAKGIVQ